MGRDGPLWGGGGAEAGEEVRRRGSGGARREPRGAGVLGVHFLLRYRECSGGMKSKTTFVRASQVWSGRICISDLFIFCNFFDSLYGEEEEAQAGGL